MRVVVLIEASEIELGVHFPPRLGLYSYRTHCLDSPRFFSTCSHPTLSHGLEQVLPALTLQVQLWPLASAHCWDDVSSGSQLHLYKIGLSIWRAGSFRTLPSSSLHLSALTLGLSADLLRGGSSPPGHIVCGVPGPRPPLHSRLLFSKLDPGAEHPLHSTLEAGRAGLRAQPWHCLLPGCG